MAGFVMRSLRSSLPSSSPSKPLLLPRQLGARVRTFIRRLRPRKPKSSTTPYPTSGVSWPLSGILKELNKRVGDSLVKDRIEIWVLHIVNRIMNLHAPGWSGEVRSISYSADGKTVSVVYRVTLYGTDTEWTSAGYGDPVQKAEAMAFRRACACFGLGLHLYHEDML
ncbi:hypothetical protein ACJRO7_025888 [Eucalyptus globulus]|uniref:Uncharacterized protein n=1 Tax=Eucalyptus globulus TaxID=34317 RepID=A0ABD3KIZ2_EUCGL